MVTAIYFITFSELYIYAHVYKYTYICVYIRFLFPHFSEITYEKHLCIEKNDPVSQTDFIPNPDTQVTLINRRYGSPEEQERGSLIILYQSNQTSDKNN